MTAAKELVTVERSGAVAVVTLNRPEAMNALSSALRRRLSEAMAEVSADAEVRAVVLTGAGERAFTAGLDLKELGSDPAAMDGANADTAERNPALAVTGCPKPVIGAINGVAITGGFELALACDILIASEKARFADTHARIGIMPGWGLSQKLPRIVGASRAKEISLSGNFLDAATACDWGLVNRVVPAGELMDAAMKLAQDIAQADPEFVTAYKRLIDDGMAGTLKDGLALETARSRPWNAAQTPEAIEARRGAVMDRGRSQ